MTDQRMPAFVQENVPGRSGLRSAVVEFAARERGLEVERLDRLKTLIRTPSANVPFVGLNGPDTSHVGRWFSQHKDRLRALFERSGLPVAPSAGFGVGEEARATGFAKSHGWQVTISAAGVPGSWADSRRARDASEFQRAWRRVQRRARRSGERRLLVEKQIAGETFEFFVVDDRIVAVLCRPCTSVVGDGDTALGDLLERKSAERAAHPSLREYPIPEDAKPVHPDTDARFALTDVPKDGEQVVLRSGRDLCGGRDIVDVSENVDPRFAELVVEALKVTPGLAYGGVSIIAPSVERGAFHDGSHVVNGVDYSPAPLAHFPTHGQPRDIAGAIMDHYLTAPRWEAARRVEHQTWSA